MKMWKGYAAGVAVLLLLLSIAQPAAADTLYGVTFNDELISINPATGAGTLVGNLGGGPVLPFGLSDRGNELWTFNQQSDMMVQLDPATGAILSTVDIGVATIGEGAVAFRGDGVGFLASSDNQLGTLWSFDVTTAGSGVLIGAIDGLDPSVDGLDFDGADVLYGLSQTDAALYTIDQTTGATTFVGDTGLMSTLTFLQGLTFRSDGSLYGAVDDSLYTIDVATGAANLVGPIGFAGVSGLSFLVPVPAAVWTGLLLLGGLGVARLVQSRRAA